MAGAVNTIGQSKRGGGDHSSRAAQLQARENEQKALSLWIKGATFQQIAAAGFGIATASGAWHAVHRALPRIPKQARQRRVPGMRFARRGSKRSGEPTATLGERSNARLQLRWPSRPT